MDKERKDKEGEKLLPDKEVDSMPDREMEYEENSNEKYRDQTPDDNKND